MEGCKLQFLRELHNEPGEKVPVHLHTCYELVYYKKGGGKSLIGKHEFEYKDGTFVVLPPHIPHSELPLQATDLCFIGFLYKDDKYKLAPRLYEDFDGQAIGRILEQLFEEWKQKKPFYTQQIDTLVQGLVVLLFREFYEEKRPESSQLSLYIKHYIDEHINDNISLKELAKMSGYSYDWLRHVFKEQTKYSLSEYILSRRLEKATALLLTTDHSVTKIAQECRFSSTSQFISYFKQYHNHTPHQFRKMPQDEYQVRYIDI